MPAVRLTLIKIKKKTVDDDYIPDFVLIVKGFSLMHKRELCSKKPSTNFGAPSIMSANALSLANGKIKRLPCTATSYRQHLVQHRHYCEVLAVK